MAEQSSVPENRQDTAVPEIRQNFKKVEFACEHYRRRCKLLAPCCNRVFTCRNCHNDVMGLLSNPKERHEPVRRDVERFVCPVCDAEQQGSLSNPKEPHELVRRDVERVVCAVCDTEQQVAKVCSNCGVNMGEYFCEVCRFYDDQTEKKQFHCNDCGICRDGGHDKFFHCQKCGSCYIIDLRDNHACVENAMKNCCPICYEYLFDSVKGTAVLKCGHTINEECFSELFNKQQYWCPICSKSAVDMSRHWQRLDNKVAATPMPDEYQYEVAKVCSNCGVNIGEYFCEVCRFYDDQTEKKQFHCDDCGICRDGGRDKFFHCQKCGSCYIIDLHDNHACVENAMKNGCPICYEYLFDSVKGTAVLKCGHTIHEECFSELLNKQQYRCPMCSKSAVDLSRHWQQLDNEVAVTPMPDEYQYKVCRGITRDIVELDILPRLADFFVTRVEGGLGIWNAKSTVNFFPPTDFVCIIENIVGNSDGIVCILCSGYFAVLINPWTERYCEIPLDTEKYPNLGFGGKGDKLRIVKVTDSLGMRDVDIYDVKEGSWKKGPQQAQVGEILDGNGVLVGDHICWRLKTSVGQYVVRYDMENEIWDKIVPLESIGNVCHLCEFDGSLCVSAFQEGTQAIWLLIEDAWCPLLNCDARENAPLPVAFPVGYVDRGIIFAFKLYGSLFLYLCDAMDRQPRFVKLETDVPTYEIGVMRLTATKIRKGLKTGTVTEQVKSFIPMPGSASLKQFNFLIFRKVVVE